MATVFIYVTKYALTQGIVKCAKLQTESFGVTAEWPDGYNGRGYFSRGSYALSMEEALQMAEAMRAKKLASLRKQITKLEGLKIKVKGE
jgi:hypothetical protein